jgi:hypothetical protein
LTSHDVGSIVHQALIQEFTDRHVILYI